MSINMDTGGTEYADHEVQVIGANPTANGGSPESVQVEVPQELYDPVSERGIDSDELAELVAMYRSAHLYVPQDENTGQSREGAGLAEFNLGINLSGKSELPTDGFTNAPTSSEETIENGNLRRFNTNEPGALDHSTISVTPGFTGDTGASSSSGSAGVNVERFINFREEFGSGPYVDRTDDLTIGAEIQKFDMVSGLDLEVRYTLYWNVEEMPEGRASFARP